MRRRIQWLTHRLGASGQTPKWLAWATINLSIAAYFCVGLVAPASIGKTRWLPGETSHGHYQIEMDCDACHDPSRNTKKPTSADVMQDACIRCHGTQLQNARDTHPAKKFRDPTNAVLLEVLDAQNCLSCHQEHVPEQTTAMGLTMPKDYCWHCHQEIADSRPSHQGMAFDSCATAGCHNYHDNRALYEKYLDDHFGQPDHLDVTTLPLRRSSSAGNGSTKKVISLSIQDADYSPGQSFDTQLVNDWAETEHAAVGVNCTGCHRDDAQSDWSDAVSMDRCARCHADQVDSFQTGKHGMRLSVGLPAMTPDQARLPMHADQAHSKLDCNACHAGHRFDSQFASMQACLRCHADNHSLAYQSSSHANLWRDEIAGSLPAGSGVSCATCHLPRLENESGVWVNHDQNANLRPNETMAREVCVHCHGLEYALSALADQKSIDACFADPPATRIKSVEMAHQWFESRSTNRSTKGGGR
ncbi:MAG: cytochrome c3 family protein [Planctomycetales bacterium]|nr:cytochrome c3 family protein [Planctomycetales bacterium]